MKKIDWQKILRNKGWKFFWLILLVCSGLFFLAWHTKLEIDYERIAASTAQSNNFFSPKVWPELVRDIGIAILLVGLVGLMLETRDWRHYFSERLKEIVIDKSYLKKLDKPELLELQTNTLKAYFDNDEIDNDNSFYSYFSEEVMAFIDKPYRENATVSTYYTISPTDSNIFDCRDEIEFTCKTMKDCLQEEIMWCPDLGDNIIDTTACSITLTLPKNLSERERKKLNYSKYFSDGKLYFKVNPAKPLEQNYQIPRIEVISFPNSTRKGYRLNLKDFNSINNLKVRVEIKYTADSRKTFSITQSDLTYKYLLALHYPNTYSIHTALFGTVKKDLLNIIEDPDNGSYIMNYESWLSSDHGVAYSFQKK